MLLSEHHSLGSKSLALPSLLPLSRLAAYLPGLKFSVVRFLCALPSAPLPCPPGCPPSPRSRPRPCASSRSSALYAPRWTLPPTPSLKTPFLCCPGRALSDGSPPWERPASGFVSCVGGRGRPWENSSEVQKNFTSSSLNTRAPLHLFAQIFFLCPWGKHLVLHFDQLGLSSDPQESPRSPPMPVLPPAKWQVGSDLGPELGRTLLEPEALTLQLLSAESQEPRRFPFPERMGSMMAVMEETKWPCVHHFFCLPCFSLC